MRKAIILSIFFILVALNYCAFAEPSVELTIDVLSQYVWRGYALSHDSAVIQPSLTFSYKGFSANIWGNYDTDEDKPGGDSEWNETDYTLSYEYQVLSTLNVNLGTIYYELDEAKDSFEIFGGFSLNLKYLDLAFNAYREISHYPGWWLQFSLSKSITIPHHGISLDMSTSFIYQDSDDEGSYPDPDDPNKAFDGWQSGNISLVLNIPITEKFIVSPKIMYSFPLSGDASDEIKMLSWEKDDDFIYGGICLKYSF